MKSRVFFAGLSLWLVCQGTALLCGCHRPVLKPKSEPDEISIADSVSKPLPPEETKKVMKEVGENWLYGQGVGDTALAAGTVVAFPPYAALLLGNAVLSISGYEPLWLSDVLPEDERGQWKEFYDTLGQAPGRVNAAVAGKEYRTKEAIKQRYRDLLGSAEQRQKE